MNMFTSLIVISSIISCAFGTTDLLNGDSLRLPSVVPGDSPPVASPARTETFFDKLSGPLSFFQNGIPCIGSSSLKAGKCLAFDTCVADGGFGDGKGFCFGDVVCCVKPVGCGEISLINNTILANPGFPSATNQAGSCSVKLVKPFGITHIKLMIHDLELAKPDPHSGKCDTDSFTVSGGVAPGFKLGKICGLNAKTHLYIPTLIEVADIFINVDLADDASIKRRWLIRAELIEAKSPSAPPKGCVQYFRDESGILTSLNFDLNKMEGLGNIDGLKYAICIDSKSESCSVRFDNLFFHLGGNLSSHVLPFSDNISKKVFRSINPEAEMLEMMIESRAARPNVRPYTIYSAPRIYGYNRPAVYPSVYQVAKPTTTKVFRPSYHRPSFYAPSRYPISEFLYKVPSHVINPYMHRPLSVLHHPSIYSGYSGSYTEPMKKPDVDADKFDKLDKLEGKLDDKLGGKLGDKLDKFGELLGLGGESFKADGLPRVCPNQDVLIFPTPDDGTSPIHCGNDLHFGQSLVSTNSPFVIKVSNKGSVHGKGFAVSYKIQC